MITEQEFKVGQRVLHRSGANIRGYEGKEGIIKVVKNNGIFGTELSIDFEDGEGWVLCYAHSRSNRELDVEILES